MSGSPQKSIRFLTAGITALVIAMGISRFAYTPLLPIMQYDAGLSDVFAGYLASINYAGYLAGALWIAWRPPTVSAVTALRLHLLVNIASTLLMGCIDQFIVWSLLRFVGGFSSAMIFVLASGVVLQHLAHHRRQGWSGWLYSAIGIGIVITALTVPPLGELFGWRGAWFGLALISFLLAYPAYYWLAGEHPPPPTGSAETPGSREAGMLPWLAAAYFCAGLGYIVTGTFLVTMLQRVPGLENSSTLAWLVVGLAAAPSSVVWMRVGLRLGPAPALIAAHLVQALGIALPIVWTSIPGTLLGALFYGGTFMGIVTLSMYFGRLLTPGNPHRTIGLLTAAFGTGQIIGPSLGGLIAASSRSFSPALWGAAGVVTLGAVLLAVGLARTKERPAHIEPP